ncbi:MAG: hypothetical protein HY650_08610 [Acidobacteria bacterium]|nr:hypothetical protein [Acidobacteriota bacterium]
MANGLRGLPDSFLRVLVVFLVLIVAVIVIGGALPTEFKDHSRHVQATIAREAALPIRFAGSTECGTCHDEARLKQIGYHRNLSCETCHGAAKAHTENPVEVKPAAPRKRESCATCHHFDPSRPTGFAQINPVMHFPRQACISCHDPHQAQPPSVPEECSACHAEIARTKAVSPHALLECTECHTVPAEHKVAPRITRASIPTERGFCGKCHDKDTATLQPPKIDINTHGEKYLCWQCHYPHMPEVR